MKPERLQEVEDLFHTAVELPEAEQRAFLARACERDDELRRQVERLLAADQRAEVFLGQPLLGERQTRAQPTLGGKFRAQVGQVQDLLRDLWERARNDQTDARTVQDDAADLAVDLETFNVGRIGNGTVLAGRYRLERLLGTGGMGEVYRAEDLKLGQTVAIKILYASLQDDAKSLGRFLDEVRIARQISHPNICRVFDVGEADELHFISMEYIDGEHLAAWLRRTGHPPRDQAARMAHELCLGLAAAHQKGVLHRDLKPANLMIDRQGKILVTDFGLAVLAERIRGQEARLGTPAYMAPEQHAGREASVQSDLYALGLVLYELFTGQPAFPYGLSRDELARLHQEEPPTPPSQVDSEIHPSIERIILKCLAKDPQDRPASAMAVASALADGAGAVLKTLVVIAEPPKASSAVVPEPLAHQLLERYEGRRLATVDATSEEDVLLFDHPINGVRFALAWRAAAVPHSSSDKPTTGAGSGIGIHLGEVQGEADELAPSTVDEVDRDIVVCLSRLAMSGQILVTRGAFDLARQKTLEGFQEVQWLAHGSWEVRGLIAPLELCEVGIAGQAPLQPPPESAAARRQIVQEMVSGWRPAPKLALPRRPDWVMSKKLGEGGFGEIWLAYHRISQKPRVFKFCYDSARLRALQREITLFRLLREALGDRRDITRIRDWSFNTAPYYIESEYTAGGNLQDWAEEKGGLGSLPLTARLKLIIQIADALAAAHSVGVLHKDVKPGNVLITDEPDGSFQAQLSDFGVGFLTERDRLADFKITELGLTNLTGVTGQQSSTVGTRLYMAPELLEGRPATLQSDIYALGVMLYQIVVGDLSRALAPGWERDVDDELLIEDIAVAVDRAVARRLSSAAQLATRLRQLESRRRERREAERREAEAEHNRQALIRNRKRRRFAAVGALVLLGFASMTWLQSRRVEQEAAEAQQASELLIQFFQLSDPGKGHAPTMTVREYLDLGLEKLDDTKIDKNSKILAPLFSTLATVYNNLGVYDKAEELIEKALKLLRQRYGEEHPEVADSLHLLADIKREQGELFDAEQLALDTLDLRRKLFGEEHAEVAESLELLALIAHYQSDLKNAEEYYREALAMRYRLFGDDPLEVAMTKVNLAVLLHAAGSLDEAEELHREVLAVRRQQHPGDHPDIAFSLDTLARVPQTRGDYDQAEKLFNEALAMRRRIFGEDHHDVAETLRGLGNLFMEKGDLARAESTFEKALQINLSTLGAEHPYVASILADQGRLRILQGDDEQAESLLRQALEIRRVKPGEQHRLFIDTLRELGQLALQRGRYDEAEALFRRLIDGPGVEAAAGDATADRLKTYGLRLLARVHLARGKPEDAQRALLEAQSLCQNTACREMPEILRELAPLLELQGHVEQAADKIRQAIVLYKATYSDDHPRVVRARQELAALLSIEDETVTGGKDHPRQLSQ